MSSETLNPTVLLVDDEVKVTEALQRAMRRNPFNIVTADSAAAAQEILAQQHVDVVISDEQMPGMSGSEFLAQVRKDYPQTIRMILSGQANLEAAVRAINEGEVYRFFLKPCNPIDLAFTIQQAVSHRRLEEKSRQLLREFQRQAAELERAKRTGPDLLHLDTDEQGAVLISEGEESLDDLMAEMDRALRARGA